MKIYTTKYVTDNGITIMNQTHDDISLQYNLGDTITSKIFKEDGCVEVIGIVVEINKKIEVIEDDYGIYYLSNV